MDGVRLVVFDWAGTTIDFGSLAPLDAFITVFAARGVTVTSDEAREPMGRHKKEHLRIMLQMPSVAEKWRQRHGGRAWTEADLEEMYRELVPRQMESIERHSRVIDGVVSCVAELRRRGIRVAGATGYFPEATARVARLAAEQGYVTDANIGADEVAAGRPAPWMIFRLMERLNVYPPTAVLKIGDTRVDIEEGLNARVWSVGVTSSSSEVGLTTEQFANLEAEARRRILDQATTRLRNAGAHEVIETIAEVPALVDRINQRIKRGERP